MRHSPQRYAARCARTSLAALVALGVLCCLPVRAFADKPTKAQQQHAEQLFEKSAEAYRSGDFKAAVALLKEAYAIDPEPALLYNLARAYEGLGDVDLAIETYERYLKADPKAKDRGAIEQRVVTIKREREEKAALAKQRDDERRRADEAARAASEAEAQRTRDAATVGDAPPRSRSVLPYVIMGAGVASLGVGTVFGVMASSKHSDAETARTQQDAIATQDSAESSATISTVGLIAGGTLVAAGAVWWLLDTPRSTQRGSAGGPRVGLGPAFVTVGGAF